MLSNRPKSGLLLIMFLQYPALEVVADLLSAAELSTEAMAMITVGALGMQLIEEFRLDVLCLRTLVTQFLGYLSHNEPVYQQVAYLNPGLYFLKKEQAHWDTLHLLKESMMTVR